MRYGSFKVDHSKLDAGLYLSRVDDVVGGTIYTVDIRVKKPYFDETLNVVEAHSIEHVLATELEKLSNKECQKVYWGVMGCMTGFYYVCFIPQESQPAAEDAADLILKQLRDATSSWNGVVPFNSEIECGNCKTLAVFEWQLAPVADIIKQINAMAVECLSNGHFDTYTYIED